MGKRIILSIGLGMVMACSCFGQAVRITNGWLFISAQDDVKYRVLTETNQTSPWLEFVNNGTNAFSLPASGIIPSANVNIQKGTNIMANAVLVTNTFSTAFASAPVVVACANTNVTAFVYSITASNFVLGASASNATLQWIAVGP